MIINLISNAIKYTNPGGTVDYCVEQVGDVEAGMNAHAVKPIDVNVLFDTIKHLIN